MKLKTAIEKEFSNQWEYSCDARIFSGYWKLQIVDGKMQWKDT